MKLHPNVVFLVLASIAGWATAAEKQHMVNGTYREPRQVESVGVREEVVEFRIKIPKLNADQLFSGTYHYSVLPDGHIRVNASSNDSVFVFGVNRFGWIWDGKNIVRKDPKSGETVIFSLGRRGN